MSSTLKKKTLIIGFIMDAHDFRGLCVEPVAMINYIS